MSIAITASNGKAVAKVQEFNATSRDDIKKLPKYPNCAFGSTCTVKESNGNISIWELFPDNEWTEYK